MTDVALVTGSSRGIGAATAALLARKGFAVCINYLEQREKAEALVAQLRAEQCTAMCVQADVSDRTQVDALQRVFAVNYGGCFHCSQAVIGPMLHAHEGCIINISSIWGLHGASCESVYSSTKHAIIGLTRSLAAEFALSGIRVNCVAPGVIDTDMIQALGEETLEQLRGEMPFRRFGTPEEVAESVWHLASSKYITGQVLTVDGGFLF